MGGQLGDALEKLAVCITEGGGLVRVDVDLADHAALARDGYTISERVEAKQAR